MERGIWKQGTTVLKTQVNETGLVIELASPSVAVKHIQLQWKAEIDPSWKLLGDAWERAYGDLQWAAPDPKRVMPWYFLVYDGHSTHGYGVMTGSSSLCYWKVDPEGMSLWADVRCGGMGVQLGTRRLPVCTVVSRKGKPDESAFQAARAFCRMMCPKPRLPQEPVYGFNDWYYIYGENTAVGIVEDAKFTASVSPKDGTKPFMVIDDGWQANPDDGPRPWDRGNAKFPSMPDLAADIRKAGCRPGVWYRPLEAAKDDPRSWRLSRNSKVLDPTVPGVLKQVAQEIALLRRWGFELIKHDYSTFDISGQWGFKMGERFTADGWTFANRGVTTAEVILELYRCIREASEEAVVIGCNTVSHLSAGIFELDRIGDDTSGKEWDRTRKMGVNCLAFRAPQHGTFYLADPDCFGLAEADAIPWGKNRQWLNLAARSGMPLFISVRRAAINKEQEEALREAMAIAAKPQSMTEPLAEPLDWMETLLPRRWKLMGENVEFNW
ncbi:MAG: hypothetical protein HYR76_00375 [Ignavibacteria bacterium]|nr:hypothetical protein [Ignavibacteria bacterium]MBI3766648.1 hypothetical protein [Ignavibacteriales bacterium]